MLIYLRDHSLNVKTYSILLLLQIIQVDLLSRNKIWSSRWLWTGRNTFFPQALTVTHKSQFLLIRVDKNRNYSPSLQHTFRTHCKSSQGPELIKQIMFVALHSSRHLPTLLRDNMLHLALGNRYVNPEGNF